MPYMLQHICSEGQEPQPYSISLSVRGGLDLTRVLCPNPACREEMFILGHEAFGGAESTDSEALGRRTGLPPGFVIASRRAG